MQKILILYFSGAGATKKVAELMYFFISQICIVDIFSIENHADFDMNNYDALIIGTPVYHAAPSYFVTDYFDSISPLTKATPAFIYNARATWSCNTNRILAIQIRGKNIITIMDKDYRSPASDGSLIVPFIHRFFEFEKNLQQRITLNCNAFLKLLQEDTPQGYIPRFRFSSVINAPNKLAGQITTFKIHLHRDKCNKCGKCIDNCPHNALDKDNSGYPVFITKNCENCYRCIHHCPQKALSLSKRKAPEKVLKY
ncbi:MAG: EFR1 family ferrodoxin [Lachnospiraceae bacterium]